MTQTLTKNHFNFKEKKKLDINKLVLIFSVFLQSYVHKYTGSVNRSNINIYFLYKYSYASGFTTEYLLIECFRCIRLVTSAGKKKKKKKRGKIKGDRVKQNQKNISRKFHSNYR